jgi:hypothetical protein
MLNASISEQILEHWHLGHPFNANRHAIEFSGNFIDVNRKQPMSLPNLTFLLWHVSVKPFTPINFFERCHTLHSLQIGNLIGGEYRISQKAEAD